MLERYPDGAQVLIEHDFGPHALSSDSGFTYKRMRAPTGAEMEGMIFSYIEDEQADHMLVIG
jgi:hypothetical protein